MPATALAPRLALVFASALLAPSSQDSAPVEKIDSEIRAAATEPDPAKRITRLESLLPATQGDPVRSSSVQILLGRTHDELLDYSAAKRRYEEALAITEGVERARNTRAAALSNLAVLERQGGELQSALNRLAEARTLDPDDKRLATILNNEAIAYSQLGEIGLAIRQQREAIRLFDLTRMADEAAEARMTLVRMELKNGAKAPELEAILQRVPETAGSNANSAAYRWNTIGLVRESKEQYREALEAFDAALAASATRQRTLADTHHGRGRVLARLNGDAATMAAARQALAKAYAIRRDIGYLSAAADVLADRARLELDSEDLVRAEASAREAAAAFNDLRGSVTADQFRVGFWSTKQGVYDTLIETLMRRHEKDQRAGFDRLAFEASEARRSRGLLDLLAEAPNLILKDVPAGLRDRYQDLTRRLSIAAERASRASSTSAAAFTEYKRVERDLALLEAEMKQASPAYRQIVYPEPPSLPAVVAALRSEPDTVLLEISTRYAFLVSATGLETYRLPAGLEAMSRKIRELPRGAPGAPPPPGLQELEDAVFRQFRAKLSRKRILLVADGELQHIPWAALIDPQGRYLGAMHDLARQPSAGVWLELRKRRPATASVTPIHAIGDPIYSSSDDAFPKRFAQSPLPVWPAGWKVDRLLFGADELEQLKTLFGASFSESPRLFATKAALSSPKARLARTLHFVAHARAVPGRPDRSGLALSIVSEGGVESDPLLRIYDIYSLRIQADLVTLSACETASGTDRAGEGLVGLSRAFFQAGARKVVASLWKVDDHATLKLMEAFYASLKAGLSPAAALRAAQRSLIDSPDYSHPYFWAGFVLLGDWR
jgi:tetratricopeptide (TPR) repeat protein